MTQFKFPAVKKIKDMKDVQNLFDQLKKELEYQFDNLDFSNLSSGQVVVTESGDTASGSYRKYSDGTMECWWTTSFPTTSASWNTRDINGTTYYYVSGTWNYPKSFKVGSTVNVMASGDIGTAAPETHTAWHVDETHCSHESGILGVDVTGTSVTMNFSFYARGVWQ